MAVEVSADQLQKALKATQELRASVSLVFEKLHNGIKESPVSGDKEKLFLSELRECLSKVNTDVEELDKLASGVPNPNQIAALSLGSLGLLMADPTIDKTSVHTQLVHTYKWSARVHDHATYGHQFLHTHAPKRSFGSSGSSVAKRQRRVIATASSHLVNSVTVDMCLQTMIRTFPEMSMTIDRPFGAPAVMQVTIGRTLKAVIIFRGLVIEWATVKAFHEELRLDNGKIDLWSNSKYLVFQKLTTHTRSAMLHFYSPHIPAVDQAIKSFLMWLQSYKTLFSAPCRKCCRLLQDNLPPTWHDFRTFDPYHEQCRP